MDTKRVKAMALVMLLSGCPEPGTLGAECRPDGTCNGSTLRCASDARCWSVQPELVCSGDADCFCDACLKRCGSVGIKRCEYTDPSVWGSKPTVCECRVLP